MLIVFLLFAQLTIKLGGVVVNKYLNQFITRLVGPKSLNVLVDSIMQ